MIVLDDVTKTYRATHGSVHVLNGVSFSVRKGQRFGIIGRNGAGKSTLIRLISGAELPTSGTITRNMSVSWPLAFAGAFQGSLTGLDNLRFICRVYGTSYADKIDYVDDFSELGRFLREPVKTYSSGMRARLAFALSMVIEFDCFLIDEVIAVGDSRFHEKCRIELFEKRADRAMIIVSHDHAFIADHCDSAGVLREGKLTYFDSIDDAYTAYSL